MTTMKTQLTLLAICVPLTLATLQEFTAGNKLFTASVYKELKKSENGNFLVSPFSAQTVLALTQAGAKDETAEEIRTGLHLPDNQGEIKNAIKSTLHQNDLYTLKSANKVYIKDGFAIKSDFKKTATDVFDSSLENIDFTKPVEAAGAMNQWVEEQTEHKIKNLIKPEHLNDRTRTVLVNALYFKGNWSSPFERYATSKEDFYKAGKDVVKVDTMHDTASKSFYESPELKAKFLELPFEGGDVTMTIVLPDDKEGLAALESQLERVLDAPKYTKEYVSITLPKFKVETEIDFRRILHELGVRKAFKDEEADLSGIAGNKGDLVFDKVLQKTFVDVNEEGVEAAAATFAVVGVPLSGYFPSAPPKEFKADHPFIFYIKVKDLVIFAGRVVDPSP